VAVAATPTVGAPTGNVVPHCGHVAVGWVFSAPVWKFGPWAPVLLDIVVSVLPWACLPVPLGGGALFPRRRKATQHACGGLRSHVGRVGVRTRDLTDYEGSRNRLRLFPSSDQVGPRGIEPRTRGLKVRCSAD
jgi:hypothetical protein